MAVPATPRSDGSKDLDWYCINRRCTQCWAVVGEECRSRPRNGERFHASRRKVATGQKARDKAANVVM